MPVLFSVSACFPADHPCLRALKYKKGKGVSTLCPHIPLASRQLMTSDAIFSVLSPFRCSYAVEFPCVLYNAVRGITAFRCLGGCLCRMRTVAILLIPRLESRVGAVQMHARRLVVTYKSSGMLFEPTDAFARIPEGDFPGDKTYRDGYLYLSNWPAYFIRFSRLIKQAPA